MILRSLAESLISIWEWFGRDPLDLPMPRVSSLWKFPNVQAAYREYLNTPLVWSTIDRAEIENQIRRAFEALGQGDRPVRWFDSFAPAHNYVSGKVLEAIEQWAKDCIDGEPEGETALSKTFDENSDVKARAACSRSWDAAMRAAVREMEKDVPWGIRAKWLTTPPKTFRPPDASEFAHAVCAEAAAERQPDPLWNSARQAAWGMATHTASRWVERARELALMSVRFEHGAAVENAQREEGALARSAYAALRRACAAGLWCFWVRDDEVVAVPAPNLYTNSRGRLHRYDGPAVEWPDETYWFVDGLQSAREIAEARRPPSARNPQVGLRVGAAALALALLGLNVYLSRSLAGQVLVVTIAPFMLLLLGSERRDLRTLSSLAAVFAFWALADVAWRLHRSGQLPIVEIATTSVVLAASLFLSCLGALVLWKRVAFERR